MTDNEIREMVSDVIRETRQLHYFSVTVWAKGSFSATAYLAVWDNGIIHDVVGTRFGIHDSVILMISAALANDVSLYAIEQLIPKLVPKLVAVVMLPCSCDYESAKSRGLDTYGCSDCAPYRYI